MKRNIYVKSGVVSDKATWKRGTGKKYILPEFCHPADTAYTDNPSVLYTFENWGNKFCYSHEYRYPTLANALEFLGYGYTQDGIEEYFQSEPERKVIRITKKSAKVQEEDFDEDFDELPENYWEFTKEEHEDLYNTYWEAYL